MGLFGLTKTTICHDILGEHTTFFLEDPSVRYKQYKTTAGMYINKSATRTETEQGTMSHHIHLCK